MGESWEIERNTDSRWPSPVSTIRSPVSFKINRKVEDLSMTSESRENSKEMFLEALEKKKANAHLSVEKIIDSKIRNGTSQGNKTRMFRRKSGLN